MRNLHFLIVTAIAASAFGQGLSPTDAYVEAHHQHYESRQEELVTKLAAIEAQLKHFKDAKIDRLAGEANESLGEGDAAITWFSDAGPIGVVTFRTAREKRAAVEKFERLYIDPLKQELRDLPLTYDAERPSMPLSCSHPGIIDPYVFFVYQVISDDGVLLRTSKAFKDTTLYLKGVATKDMIDGEHFSSGGAYYSTGTTTYVSVDGGTNTVRVIEPFDTTEAEEIIKEKAAELRREIAAANAEESAAAEKALEKKRASLTREFADITGKFKVMAEYVGYASGNVRLKKENGETISVPLAKLSDADRRWVAEKNAGR